MTRTTNDVMQVQTLVLMFLTVMVTAPITCAGAVVLALGQDVPVSGLLLLIIPVLTVIVIVVHRRTRTARADASGPTLEGCGHATDAAPE